MIPDGLIRLETPGERQFYEFLCDMAQPDGRFLCWYQPDVRDSEPDFLLFGNDGVGILVFEVKDWGVDSIEELTPDRALLRKGTKCEEVKNCVLEA